MDDVNRFQKPGGIGHLHPLRREVANDRMHQGSSSITRASDEFFESHRSNRSGYLRRNNSSISLRTTLPTGAFARYNMDRANVTSRELGELDGGLTSVQHSMIVHEWKKIKSIGTVVMFCSQPDETAMEGKKHFTHVAISKDGRLLVCAEGKTVRVWDSMKRVNMMTLDQIKSFESEVKDLYAIRDDGHSEMFGVRLSDRTTTYIEFVSGQWKVFSGGCLEAEGGREAPL